MTDSYETNPGGKIYSHSGNPNGYIGAADAKARIDSALDDEKEITEGVTHDRKAEGILTRTIGRFGSKILGSDGPEEAAEQFRSDRDGLATLPGTIADKIRGR